MGARALSSSPERRWTNVSNRDDDKRLAAYAALEQIEPGWTVGVGTGSTANWFIDGLGEVKRDVAGAVASSEASAERLRDVGIPLVELWDVGRLPIYVDGADEATRRGELIKGGGGALTREKIVAEASDRFVCIVDSSKVVERLGAFPLPVEIVPLARRQIAERLGQLGGRPVLREGFTTDNGNAILDVHDLKLDDPQGLEAELNQIPGVVTNGLFCRRPADLLIVADRGHVSHIR
ncbi:MAG: ribose-5-phosphate isomerase RpiA [bacterium]|nr:ribose-5-phosphate isomerase RpiA [bacterium]